MQNFSYSVLDFFNFFELKMFIYFYWFCMAPTYYTQECADFYTDLLLNYETYYNNLLDTPTKLFDEDFSDIMWLNDIFIPNYLNVFSCLENVPEYIHDSWFKKIFMLMILAVLYFFLLLFVIKRIILDYLPSVGLLDLSQFYFEWEHNVGNGEDLLMIVSFTISLILWVCCYFYVSSQTLNIFIVFLYLGIILIFIPIRIALSFGSNLINYIKGTSESNKFSIELFSDTITLIVFFVRFSLQAVRLVLIFIFYFSIHEFVFSLPKEYFLNLSNSWSKWGRTMGSCICDLFRWAFELLDSTISIANQIASFFFVIFWLFSYINTYELKRKKLFWFKSFKITFIPENALVQKKIFSFKINH